MFSLARPSRRAAAACLYSRNHPWFRPSRRCPRRRCAREFPSPFFVQSELSEWTDSRMPPFWTLPSYRLASYSGMPRPISAPADSADCAADGAAGQRRHDRPRCDERAKAGNRQRADAGQPAERSADDRAGAAARRGALGRLRALHVREVLAADVCRKQHGDVGVAEPCRPSTHRRRARRPSSCCKCRAPRCSCLPFRTSCPNYVQRYFADVLEGATSVWLITFPEPATCVALAATAACSCGEFTGPVNVT